MHVMKNGFLVIDDLSPHYSRKKLDWVTKAVAECMYLGTSFKRPYRRLQGVKLISLNAFAVIDVYRLIVLHNFSIVLVCSVMHIVITIESIRQCQQGSLFGHFWHHIWIESCYAWKREKSRQIYAFFLTHFLFEIAFAAMPHCCCVDNAILECDNLQMQSARSMEVSNGKSNFSCFRN